MYNKEDKYTKKSSLSRKKHSTIYELFLWYKLNVIYFVNKRGATVQRIVCCIKFCNLYNKTVLIISVNAIPSLQLMLSQVINEN